jgi:hypothetical protein
MKKQGINMYRLGGGGLGFGFPCLYYNIPQRTYRPLASMLCDGFERLFHLGACVIFERLRGAESELDLAQWQYNLLF